MWKHTSIYPNELTATDLKTAIHAILNIPYFDIAYVVNIRYETGHIRPIVVVKRTLQYDIFTEEGEQVYNRPNTLTNIFSRTLCKATGKPCLYKQLCETTNSTKNMAGASQKYANNLAGLYVPIQWNGTHSDESIHIKNSLTFLIDTFRDDT